MAFVGQIGFVDSHDLFPGLPGEVLLVFGDAQNLLDSDAYHCEWVGLNEDDLASSADVPEVPYTWRPGSLARKRGKGPEVRRFELFVCHGVIHRTYDLPGEHTLFAAYEDPRAISVLEATKIGGAPHAVQSAPGVAGRFVAQVASIQPAPEVPFPWVNVAAALTLRERHAIPTWKLGDMGSLYLYEENGNVRLETQSY